MGLALPLAAEEFEWATGPSTSGKPNHLNQILREDESRCTEGQKRPNSLSPELMATHVCLPTSWSKK